VLPGILVKTKGTQFKYTIPLDHHPHFQSEMDLWAMPWKKVSDLRTTTLPFLQDKVTVSMTCKYFLLSSLLFDSDGRGRVSRSRLEALIFGLQPRPPVKMFSIVVFPFALQKCHACYRYNLQEGYFYSYYS
jgi:hypothetical protein